MKLRIAAFLTIPAALIVFAPGVAHAFPPQALPTVTCTTITIDPDPGWGVAFDGTIGTHTGLHLVASPIPGTHDSQVSIAGLTTATGEIHWSITPVWTVPPNPYGVTSGNGPTTEGVLTCHEPSTTTTTTASTTTTPRSSTTSSVATSSSTSTPSTTIAGVSSSTPTSRVGTAITARAPELPRTGSDTGPLTFLGSGLVGAGLSIWGLRVRGRR